MVQHNLLPNHIEEVDVIIAGGTSILESQKFKDQLSPPRWNRRVRYRSQARRCRSKPVHLGRRRWTK